MARSRPGTTQATGRSRRGQRKRTRKLPGKNRPVPPAPTPERIPPHTQAGLTLTQHTFALAYLGNGFNATQAYRRARPTAATGTAAVAGFRLLRNAKVRGFLQPQLEAAWQLQQIGGEQALALVGRDATADIRLLFDAKGDALKPHAWPEEIASSVESYEIRGDGSVRVKLAGKLAARRIILEQTGKIKSPGDSIDALAEAIRTDIERHTKGAP
jgi:phage terminase small subunit